MISGSHDSQTSADVYNTGKFQLPNPAVSEDLFSNERLNRTAILTAIFYDT